MFNNINLTNTCDN